MQTPDTWQVVKITANDTGDVHHRLMCGWYGGFLVGDSWKMSSGIEKIIEKTAYWEIPQTSGSIYICHKGSEKLGNYAAGMLNHLIKTAKDVTIEQVKLNDILEQYKDE
jgi:hypothetical protein